jgi:hypothetical protein
MFLDHCPDALVIVPGASGLVKLSLRELLPFPYRR